MKKTLNERIQAIREKAGDNPNAAAEKIGISRNGYIKWETGDTANMKLDHFLKFCDVYRIDPVALLRGAPETTEVAHEANEPPAAYATYLNSPDAQALVDIYLRLTPEVRGEFLTMIIRSYLELRVKHPEIEIGELGKVFQFVR